MNIHDATEAAYKNGYSIGYEAGLRDRAYPLCGPGEAFVILPSENANFVNRMIEEATNLINHDIVYPLKYFAYGINEARIAKKLYPDAQVFYLRKGELIEYKEETC